MRTSIPSQAWKAVLIGGFSGAVVFFILSAAKAQTILNVADVHANPALYIGSNVQVTGIAKSIRLISKTGFGRKVPYTVLDLYEMDAKGRRGSHFIYVSVPTSAYSAAPIDGQMATITGTLKEPSMVGQIDQFPSPNN
jgi:hypothetical protein